MQTNRWPFHVKSTGQLPVLRLFSARSSFWLAATLSSHCMTPSGQRRWTRSALSLSAQAEHDRGDRLAQAGFGRRVVVGDVDPLPFDEHAGSDRVRVGPHQLGLDPPVPAELEGQPVLAVAQVPGQRGGSPGRMTRMSGSGSPTRSTAVKPVEARAFQAERQGLRREALPFVARPGRQDDVARLARTRPEAPAGRAGRRGRGRSAWADRQSVALIGQDSKVI